ncbi:hypothetical protein M0R45_015469 [Rubus argutus]|uniref:Uncharacterized protein n=1 Tax=Rubus argutus TaxID=59490 RepID=A0AAW1XT58_RUBAR
MEPSAEPETTSYLWLRTNEGSPIQVEKKHAVSIPWIGKKVVQDRSCGTSRDKPITLPALVTKGALNLLPSKMKFANHEDHHNATTSEEEATIVISILKKKRPKELLEFALATHVLEMDLASEIAIGFIYEIFAKIKSPEMLCIKFEFFNVSEDDLVHMRSITDTRMTERFLPKLELGRERLLKKEIERQEKVSSL